MPSDSNARLLDRCAQGDPVAWEIVVGRYERLVGAVAARQGVAPADVADVVQSTFSILLEQLHAIHEPDRVAFWLSTVARRQAWKWLREHAREEPIRAWHLDTPSVDPEVDRTLWIQEAVAGLGEPCRTIIETMFLSDGPRTYAELATTIDRPVGSIGPLRARCLQALRDRLAIDQH